jgi:hypothetical protein
VPLQTERKKERCLLVDVVFDAPVTGPLAIVHVQVRFVTDLEELEPNALVLDCIGIERLDDGLCEEIRGSDVVRAKGDTPGDGRVCRQPEGTSAQLRSLE